MFGRTSARRHGSAFVFFATAMLRLLEAPPAEAPCNLMSNANEVTGLAGWIPAHEAEVMGDQDCHCDRILKSIFSISVKLHRELEALKARQWTAEGLNLQEAVDSGFRYDYSFDTGRYKCIYAELPGAMRMVEDAGEFFSAISLLHAKRCLYAELRLLLARFAVAVAEARAKHSQLALEIAWWGGFAKPSVSLRSHNHAVHSVIGSIESAAAHVNPDAITALLSGWQVETDSDGYAVAQAPDFHDPGGAFSEMNFLQRKLADRNGKEGWYLDRGLLVGLVRLWDDDGSQLAGDAPRLSVADLGAGAGHYSTFLNQSGLYEAHAFDGQANVENLTGGRVRHAELSQRGLWLGRTFDWVLCLEVAEHVPADGEQVFLENLARHASKGIVISWSLHGDVLPGEDVHPNAKKSLTDVEQSVLEGLGPSFVVDVKAGMALRRSAKIPWLRESLSVFIRPVPHSVAGPDS
eukprot:gnl/TRDRNA2_/TRDRNA2_161988_c1_seq3.p1 gnl/TRDRNA2_/TRDRNA2_161988_c1~~gnl/TRDRNA2_/TRDRNA2_161988_c1_seq3.p1  ORF type:complete len:464 (+),score=83.14 gnl/TRDRNA2_/TRDRNA2_161988_c1_seq3:26-1417(+)